MWIWGETGAKSARLALASMASRLIRPFRVITVEARDPIDGGYIDLQTVSARIRRI